MRLPVVEFSDRLGLTTEPLFSVTSLLSNSTAEILTACSNTVSPRPGRAVCVGTDVCYCYVITVVGSEADSVCLGSSNEKPSLFQPSPGLLSVPLEESEASKFTSFLGENFVFGAIRIRVERSHPYGCEGTKYVCVKLLAFRIVECLGSGWSRAPRFDPHWCGCLRSD